MGLEELTPHGHTALVSAFQGERERKENAGEQVSWVGLHRAGLPAACAGTATHFLSSLQGRDGPSWPPWTPRTPLRPQGDHFQLCLSL